MKKIFIPVIVMASAILFFACSSKETAQSIAKEWCDLNAKVYKAEDGPLKEAAIAARKNFEEKMQEKYKDQKEFMDEVGREVEKCEAASEGRE